MSHTFLLLSVLLVAWSGSSASNIIPEKYNVEFDTDFQSGSDSYEGNVDILFTVVDEIGQLEVHAKNLTIKDITVTDNVVDYKTQSSNLPNGNLRLDLEEPLLKGNYHLKITFSGTATDNEAMLKGSYQQNGASVGHYLMSKPKKHDFKEAPSAFPHFGEEFKANFILTIVHHESLTAWSNTPIMLSRAVPERVDYVASIFSETPKMHVFDVGFFVSDFDSMKVGNLTVVARKDIIQSTKYVGTVCNDLTAIMDNHTAISYNDNEVLSEYLLIVVPRELTGSNLTEFERKFVEEQYMLYDQEEDNFDRQAEFLKFACKNVMRQWFGNLIDPEEERLLEAFSDVYTYFNAEKVYPQELMMMHYQVDVVQESLLRDYERPSSVLNMFWLIVLDEKWAKVMQNLSKNRQPRTMTTGQLCSEAQTLWKEDYNIPEGMSLETIFNQWMYSDEEPPVLNVQRLYSEGKVVLSQGGSQKILPYNFATETPHFDQLGPFLWLTSSNETVQFDVSDDHWIIFNKEQFGMYRVNYDERNWGLISQSLQSNASNIHRVSRMQLLDDALNFVKNDQLDISVLLELLTYLRNELCYDVWYDAYNVLKTWYYREIDPPQHIKDFFIHLIEPYYLSFASNEISQKTPQMELHIRSKIAGLACWLGVKDCLQQARTRFQQAITDNSSVEPNWSHVVYCYGLQDASDDELEWLLNKPSKQHSQSTDFLSCVGNEKHMRRVLMELKTKSDSKHIGDFVVALDERRFSMFHSLLKNDSELVKMLGSATVECVLERTSKSTKSTKTLKLIEDLKATLNLHITGTSSVSSEKNIWIKPEAADFIKRYMEKYNSVA